MAQSRPHATGRSESLAADIERVVPQGVKPPASLPTQVFSAAVDSYAAGQRLDMQALARRLGLGRATLYRHAGNREQVLDQIVWWRARHALVDAMRSGATMRGVPRIVAVIGDVLRAVERDNSLRVFLATDPETALRILTGTRSVVQQGMLAALEELIDIETERGHFFADLDTPILAYAIERIGEGFLYADVIADRTPDIDRAIQVIEALLRGLHTARRG